MSIQKELQQPEFQNDYHRLRVNLLHSATWLQEQIKHFLSPFGITQKQFNMLRIVRGGEKTKALSVYEIRARMIDKMADTSRMVARLEDQKLLERRPCKEDRRHKRVYMTEKGKQILEQIDQKLPELDAILAKLTTTEARQMSDLLDKMKVKSEKE